MTTFCCIRAIAHLNQQRVSARTRRFLDLGEVWLKIFLGTLAALSLAAALACRKPVYVPVPCPEPPPVQCPDLRVRKLAADASASEVFEAYTLDLAEYVGYSQQLEALLAAYRKTKATR